MPAFDPARQATALAAGTRPAVDPVVRREDQRPMRWPAEHLAQFEDTKLKRRKRKAKQAHDGDDTT